MTKTVIIVYNFVASLLQNDNAHGIQHANRVRNWAIKIAKKEKYPDIELIEIISLLHDIGFSQTDKWSEHGKLGAKLATNFLTKNNLLTKQKIKIVEKTIKNHNQKHKSNDPLTRIIRDADMLDMIGAVGIMRTFISQSGRPIYDEKYIKGMLWESSYKYAYKNYNSINGAGKTIIDQLNFQIHCIEELSTDYSKKIAKKLCKFMTDFILQFEKELKINKI